MLTRALLDAAPTHKASEFKHVRQSLFGRVFHVTRLSSIESILTSGGLLPNRMGFWSPFGDAADGFFRAQGCVSFFDYRNCESKEWKKFRSRCEPTKVIHHDDPAVVLFLGVEHHSRLIDWTGWKAEERTHQSIVPFVEMGFPGQVKLHMICEVHIWEPTEAQANAERELELIYKRAHERQLGTAYPDSGKPAGK